MAAVFLDIDLPRILCLSYDYEVAVTSELASEAGIDYKVAIVDERYEISNLRSLLFMAGVAWQC